MQVVPLSPLFGAEIVGLDLNRPTPELAETCFELFDRYAVCVFRNAALDDAAHVAFSSLFGSLETVPRLTPSGAKARFEHAEIFDAGNIDGDGNIVMDERRRLIKLGNQLWHTDSSFRPERSSYSMLRAHRIPPSGGDTEFADMRAAYAALPDETKRRIAGLECQHSYWHSRQIVGYPPPTEKQLAAIPGACQPLVLVHPRTGEPSLYLASHASHIVGMEPGESAALLKQLTDFATQPRFCYNHVWQTGDLVVWDNLCTMHRATPFDDTIHPRDMRRTTVIDGTALRVPAAPERVVA